MAQAGGWIARCTRLLEERDGEGPEHGYMLALQAFRFAAVEHRYDEAEAAAERVIGIGRRTGDEDLVALGLNVAGRALIRAGRAKAGLVRLDEAMVAVVSGALSAPVSGTVYCSLIEACEEIAELRRAQEWTEALTRWCDRQEGMVTFTGQCLTHRAMVLRRQGEWSAAAEEARRACERFVGAADEVATGRALYQLAEVHRISGDGDAAEEAFRQAGEWGHDPQPGLALLRLSQGRTDTAAATMRRLAGEWNGTVDRIRLLPAFVEVMLAAGEVAAAHSAASELAELAAAFDTEALRAEADRARGTVALARGEHEQALVALRRACEIWRALEDPYEVARTRVLVGLACRGVGDEDSAAIETDSARRAFAELGAADDLARLSDQPEPPAHGLTPRELEVLRLVATGMTNQAIADELYVAVKTVDRHVANILTKLGVPSRTAATAFAYQDQML